MTDDTDDDYCELTAADLAHRWRERTLTERVAESIAESLGTSEEWATPESALRYLLACAWHDLQDARRDALNAQWSMDCDHHVACIAGLTRLVGPLDWGNVSVDLILDGVYEQIHEALGTPTPLSDTDRARAREVYDRRYSTTRGA